LPVPHAWERSCAWSKPWAGGGGGRPCTPGLGCGTDVPASERDRRLQSQIARAHTRAQLTLIVTATDQPLSRADGSPARGSLAGRSGRRTARSFADAWPPNLIRFQPPPAQRPQPVPALPRRAPARPPASPGMALAPGRSVYWLHHGRPEKIVLIAHGFRVPLHGRPETIINRGGKVQLRYLRQRYK
jgi:hypothetical protein